METTNQTILSRMILHGIYLHWYQNWVVGEVLTYFDEEVWPEVTAMLTKELTRVSQVRSLYILGESTLTYINTAIVKAEAMVEKEMIGFAISEDQFQRFLVQKSIPVVVDMTIPPPATVEAVVTSQPFQGELMSGWFKSLSENTAKNVQRAVNIGITAGERVDEIVRRVRGTKAAGYADGVLNVSSRNAEAIVRTAINHVSNAARQITFENNSSVLSGVRWVSTLDSRTTPICRALDGKVFPVDFGPRPPAHWGCRSTVVPVVKSWKELGINLKEAPPGTRASMDGQVPSDINYGEWLKGQGDSVQNQILGPSRAKLFRSGKVSIDRFVGDDRRSISLIELRKREGLD